MNLFEEEAPPVLTSSVILRPYQSQQKTSILDLWIIHQSVLLVSSVGSGKTTTFCSIVTDRIENGRALILAHRTELVDQAIARLKLFGIDAARDQADERAEHGRWAKDVIVGTTQTVAARLTNYDPFDFTTVVIDESHHAVAKTYQRIIQHFRQNPECKILGVTGTPDRSDEAALGQIFDVVAEPVYGIEKAVSDGWLVKPLQQMIEIEGLDLSRVRTTAGDLNAGDLSEILEKEEICQGIVSGILQNVGDMRTLVFAATVREAELLCEIFNRHTQHSAGWVCGKTPDDERRKTFKEFEHGEIQFFVNVGIATEGTDMPHVQCVANARMTKSRALYEQISGRALRTYPGCVDGLETKEERLQSILASPKPSALLLDFVGNSGKHKLMTVADILGGEITDEVLKLVNARIRKKGKPADVAEEIEKVKQELERKKLKRDAEKARRQGLVADARYSTREVNAFDGADRFQQRRAWDAPTENQCYFLRSRGHQHPEKYSKKQASAIISKLKSDPAIANQLTPKMRNILQRYNYDPDNMTFAEAKQEIDALAKNGWRAL